MYKRLKEIAISCAILISTAEFIKIANRTFEYTTPMTIQYTDVSTNTWYYNEVARAVKAII